MLGIMTTHEERREELLLPFIEKIADARVKNHISQADLARRAGLSKKYISLIEQGWRLPPMETLIFLCAAVRLPKKEVEKLIQDALAKVSWN